jgi:hypothetical protein
MSSTLSPATRGLALPWLVLALQANAADLPAAERDVFEQTVQVGRQVATPGPACTFPRWTPSIPYPALSIVMYESRPYFAKYENPGYNPAISTYFWGAYHCPASSAPQCTYSKWMQDWPYEAGSIVVHEGRLYIANAGNPGYVPTISTHYWSPHQCESSVQGSAPAQ